VATEEDAHAGVAVVDDAGREGDDFDQGLGVEQQEHPGHAVGSDWLVPVMSSWIQASR